MIRALIFSLVFLLTSCSTPAKPDDKYCPTPPKIGPSESLTDYTVRLLKLYNECAAHIHKINNGASDATTTS